MNRGQEAAKDFGVALPCKNRLASIGCELRVGQLNEHGTRRINYEHHD